MDTIKFCEYLDDVILHISGKMKQIEWEAKYPKPDYTDKEAFPHGRCIDCISDQYRNIYIYEDGYQEYEER